MRAHFVMRASSANRRDASPLLNRVGRARQALTERCHRRIGVGHLLPPSSLSLLSRSTAESSLAKESVTVAFILGIYGNVRDWVGR